MFENDIMGFREKVALVCLAVITFQTACVFSMPPIWSKKDPTMYRKNNIQTDKLLNLESIQYVKRKPPSTLKSFNFPKVEYSPIGLANPVRPETFLEESSNGKVLDHSEFLNNFRKETKRKRKYGSLKLLNEKPIQSFNENNRNLMSQIEAFPKMEYPLTASEIWAPNFWNQQSFPLQDPYFDFDKYIYKPQKSQKSIQSNSMQREKYTTIANTNIKANNKNDLPISKKADVNILQTNDKQLAKLTILNTTVSKLENNNDKPEETSENVPNTFNPKRKPKTRKIKIVTKSSNVLRDIIAKKSKTCSAHNKNSENDCSRKNQSESASHAISDVINDRKNTEISDLLSDDFDVCFVSHNFEKTANDDSQICVSFDHDKSIEELLPVSNTEQLPKNDSKYLFHSLLNNTIKIQNNNNCSATKSDQSSKNVEKIVIIDVPEVEEIKRNITDIKENVSPLNDTEIIKQLIQPLHNASKEDPTKLSSKDDSPIEKLTTTNSDHFANYELLDEDTEIRDVDTDTVLSNLEHAILNSKIDGTIDILIPKIKQAILEAIVESASFVPSHIASGVSPSIENVYYDKNRNIKDDVEFVNTDRDHNFDSHHDIRYIKEKYSVQNQTVESNVIDTSNLTKTEINPILSVEIELDNKTKSPDTLIPLPKKNLTSNRDEIVKKDISLINPITEAINFKRIKTMFGMATIMNSLKNITDFLANKRIEELQMADRTQPNLKTNITNNTVPANFSSSMTSKNTSYCHKIPMVKIVIDSINNGSENIVENNIDLPLNQKLAYVLETNKETHNASENNSTIRDILDSINECIINDHDNDTDEEIANIADVTNNYKTLMHDINAFTDVVDDDTLKRDNVTSTIKSSVTLKSNFGLPEYIHYNDNQQNSSTENFEHEEQITPLLNENNLKEMNNIYIDQSGWKIKYDEENLSPSLLIPDLETRILYADEKQIEQEPQLQLSDALKMNDNAYIDLKPECKNTTCNWEEGKNTIPHTNTMSNIETLSSSNLLSQEIKSDFSLSKHPSFNDDLLSDEFTEEIINILLDILSIEDNECNNNITNKTLDDNFRLTDCASIDINNETINTDCKFNFNEDKNVFPRIDDKIKSNNDSGSMLSALDDEIADDTTPKKNENLDNISDKIINVKNSERDALLGEMQEDKGGSTQNRREIEIAGKPAKMASYNENVNELGNNENTKKTYHNISSKNDSNTVAIGAKNIDTCTDEVSDIEGKTTLDRDDSLLDVSSSENPLGDNNEPENSSSDSIDGELEDKAAENGQNTATD